MAPDSAPLEGANIRILGGRDRHHVTLLAKTLAWKDGRFDLAVGGHTPIECSTLMIQIAAMGIGLWEARGQLRCDSMCQWLDIVISRGEFDGVNFFDLTPRDCGANPRHDTAGPPNPG
jgi:hypothetical protein